RGPAGARRSPPAVHASRELGLALTGLEPPPLGTHALRHSLAVHLLRQGVGLPTIGAALGHRHCESTAVYLRLAVEDLQEVGLPVPQGGNAAVPERRGWKRKLVPARERPRAPLGPAGFRRGLAESMRRYLRTRRALGRDYRSEEATLRRWDDFLVARYRNIRTVKPPMFQLWVQGMTALTPMVQRQRMRVVRNFLLFHARQAPDTYIPDLKTFPRPSPRRSPRLISFTEMAQLLAAAGGLPPSHRNPLRAPSIRLALVLLFCCGLRRGELFRLKIRHFDPREQVLRVEATKFHKSRLVPLSDSVAEEVRRYLGLRRSPLEPDAPLLSSSQRRGHETTYSA